MTLEYTSPFPLVVRVAFKRISTEVMNGKADASKPLNAVKVAANSAASTLILALSDAVPN